MKGDKAVLIHGANLTNTAMLAHMFAEARRYFAEYSLPQPPLPSDVASYVGCELLITDTEGDRGERLGKVTLTDADGRVRYEQDWLIAGPRY
ncbi:MAG TPA: hypothetical protein VG819_06595 [Rhizomicrobium sp.]|jgi:hypothetical protein|nr:hypothetical protein [Rhizomicrobium sp.]